MIDSLAPHPALLLEGGGNIGMGLFGGTVQGDAMNIPSKLKPIAVLDPEGRSVTLGSTWAEKGVVLVFIRHFG